MLLKDLVNEMITLYYEMEQRRTLTKMKNIYEGATFAALSSLSVGRQLSFPVGDNYLCRLHAN